MIFEGQARGERDAALDPAETASVIVAVLQGGHVLARAADDAAEFDRAVAGVVALLGRARPRV